MLTLIKHNGGRSFIRPTNPEGGEAGINIALLCDNVIPYLGGLVALCNEINAGIMNEPPFTEEAKMVKHMVATLQQHAIAHCFTNDTALAKAHMKKRKSNISLPLALHEKKHSKKDKNLNKLEGNTQANQCYTILRIMLSTSNRKNTAMQPGKV